MIGIVGFIMLDTPKSGFIYLAFVIVEFGDSMENIVIKSTFAKHIPK